MIPHSEWLSVAEGLQPGCSVKMPHKGCSQSSALMVSHGVDGYSCYCFKCHEKGWKPHASASWTEYQERKKAAAGNREASKIRGINMPADCTEDIPDVGMVWLLRGGLSLANSQRFGIRWSPKLQRVIIPMFNKETYIGFTARAVLKGHQPKYIKFNKDKEYGYIRHIRSDMEDSCGGSNDSVRKHGDRCLHDNSRSIRESCDNHVVIVEDFLSAAKCSTVCDSIYLSGTSCNIAEVYRLLQGRQCIISLDPDPAGRSGAQKLYKELKDVARCRVIELNKDPKYMCTKDLKQAFMLT